MEPIHFKIPRHKPETVRVEYWDMPYFYEPIHFHEECQLTYIMQSEGTLFLGDKLLRFREGEIYLIGQNLPHVFRNDISYFESHLPSSAKAISVFFLKETFSEILNSIPEAQNMKELLESSAYGIRLTDKYAESIYPNFKKLLSLTGIQKVFEFMHIMNLLTISNKVEIISEKKPMIMNKENSIKLNKVFDYILENYRDRISLEEVASLVCMTPTSFCRYFKKRTQKTFSQYLIEVRISHACKSLTNHGQNVAEACYSSGYNNISNFHRHFVTIMGMTPNKYRQTAINI